MSSGDFSFRWSYFMLVDFNVAKTYVSRAYVMSPNFLFMELFQWFFIVLSVLPSRIFAISAHLFSSYLWSINRIHSSSLLHSHFLIFGFRWLCHLSRHCFPILAGKYSEIIVHFYAPIFSTSYISTTSSSKVQAALLAYVPFFKTFSSSSRSLSGEIS